MIAHFVPIDDQRIWTEEDDSTGQPRAEITSLLPDSLRLLARKLWIIHKLIKETEQSDEWDDCCSLSACEALAADAGRDAELLIDVFNRWMEDPAKLSSFLTSALREHGAASETERAEAEGKTKEAEILNIADRLRPLPRVFILGLSCELSKCEDILSDKPDDNTLAACQDGVQCAANAADAGKEIASTASAESEADADDSTFAVSVMVGQYDGSVEDGHDLVVTKGGYERLRREVRELAARNAQSHADTLHRQYDSDDDANESDPAECSVRQSRNANTPTETMISNTGVADNGERRIAGTRRREETNA